ncbi:hypothetical protein PINS_up011557 [Pythium insidiosum]|nr:hypothetical protein PINS_up011557 [Pythium insidiosum]
MNDFHSSVFSRKRCFSAITSSTTTSSSSYSSVATDKAVDLDAAPMPPKRAATFAFARSLSVDTMRFLEENAMPEDAPPHPVLQRQQAVVWCPHSHTSSEYGDDEDDGNDAFMSQQPLLLRPMGAATLSRHALSFRAVHTTSHGCATRAVISKLRF